MKDRSSSNDESVHDMSNKHPVTYQWQLLHFIVLPIVDKEVNKTMGLNCVWKKKMCLHCVSWKTYRKHCLWLAAVSRLSELLVSVFYNYSNCVYYFYFLLTYLLLLNALNVNVNYKGNIWKEQSTTLVEGHSSLQCITWSLPYFSVVESWDNIKISCHHYHGQNKLDSRHYPDNYSNC